MDSWTSVSPCTVVKKYVLEVMDGTKIVGRKKGFEADVCVTVVSLSQQRSRVPGVPGLQAPG